MKGRDESTGSVDESCLDGKNRDEPTGNVDEMTPDVEDEWTIGVNKCHRTLATIGACGRQHKGLS